MYNLYITTNQPPIAALFRVINRDVDNLAPMPGVFPDYLASVSLFKGLEAGARTLSRSAMMTSGHGDFQVRFVTCITIACAARGHDVPGLKAQDDGQATKTHAEVAVGRSKFVGLGTPVQRLEVGLSLSDPANRRIYTLENNLSVYLSKRLSPAAALR